MRSTGGTDGSVYDNLLNHTELDWLFCVNKDLQMWLIPIKDITTSRHITLRTEPNKNNRGFQTYQYLVK